MVWGEKKRKNNSQIKLDDFEILYIYKYLKENNLPLSVDEDILDGFILDAGNEDGRLALSEEKPDLVIDTEYIENMVKAVAQIVSKWENNELDFDYINKKLNFYKK